MYFHREGRKLIFGLLAVEMVIYFISFHLLLHAVAKLCLAK